MITISLCMIVKNEERVLKRCLDSVRDLVDEIIIVDTGSTDATKRIAAGYTDKIYDLTWNDDFSAARNFAFSKATKEYIYSADADEVLSEENRRRFRLLKETLLPEIEIVQMKYGNQLQNGTVYNFDEEYRPKLFRRLRSFVWEEPIHETVRLEPVVYDSDIVITHMPNRIMRAGIWQISANRSRRQDYFPEDCTECMPENCSWRERHGTFWKRKIISGQKFRPRTEVRMRLRKAVVWWPEPPDCGELL